MCPTGSGSIFEALSGGKALIVVPNPLLMDNHQAELGDHLAEKRWLVRIPDYMIDGCVWREMVVSCLSTSEPIDATNVTAHCVRLLVPMFKISGGWAVINVPSSFVLSIEKETATCILCDGYSLQKSVVTGHGRALSWLRALEPPWPLTLLHYCHAA